MTRNISSVRYKNVTRPEEMMGVIALRYERLVREFKRIEPEETHDPYDGIGYNVIAYEEGEAERIIGTIRLVDERDLEYIDCGKLGIRNFDIGLHRGKRNLLVGRLVTSPEGSNNMVLAGLFACVYMYSHYRKITDLFIVANCEMKPGRVEIPDIYLKLGFEPKGEIRRKYYDNFDICSVPMHRITWDMFSEDRRSPKRMRFEQFRERIDFEHLQPERRKAIYEKAVRNLETITTFTDAGHSSGIE